MDSLYNSLKTGDALEREPRDTKENEIIKSVMGKLKPKLIIIYVLTFNKPYVLPFVYIQIFFYITERRMKMYDRDVSMESYHGSKWE